MTFRSNILKGAVSTVKKAQRPLFLSGVFGVLAASSFAEWQTLDRSGGNKIGYSVRADRQANQAVTVTVPGYSLETKVVDGKTYSVVTVPEYPGMTEAGNPDVPRVAANFLIQDGQVPNVTVMSDDYVDIKLEHPLIASKGHLTRDISPDSVPLTFSEVYEKDAFYPNDVLASVSEPFTIHNIDGVNIHFNFFQYNPVTQTLRIHKKVELSLESTSPNRFVVQKQVPSFVSNMLQDSFINFEAVAPAMRMEKASESGRMVIICYDDFTEEMAPFVEWKRKSGLDVKMVKMSEVGSTAEDIKAFVQAEFDAGNLSYLHLVGDVEQIPTLRGTVERAHSDQSYGLLAGDDWYLDIIVSRFSAQTADKVAYQVAKTVNYESNPDVNGDWYAKGVGIASNEGNPKDWEYANTLRDGLMAFTYTEIDQIYDPKGNRQMVADAVNNGRSVINYIGHGSSTAWVSSGFSTYDIPKLTNGNMLPYIWSVACVNGAFAGSRESFAEAWLNAGGEDDVKGAVAVAAASTNMQWVPPLHWQARLNLELLPAKNDRTFGGLSLGGMSAIAEKYGPTSKSFKMFVEQTNNFGDGSLMVRYEKPAAASLKNVSYERNGMLNASVVTEGNRAASGLTVTVYDKSMNIFTVKKTDDMGNINIDFDGANASELYMTVTGNNIVPIVDHKIRDARSTNFEKLYNE